MKINIAAKLFLGFLVIICLNASFVLVVGRLTSINNIASILKRQNEVKNSLVKVAAFHANQARSRIIYSTLGNDESAKNFFESGDIATLKLDTISLILKEIFYLDSITTKTSQRNEYLLALTTMVDVNIIHSNTIYNEAFKQQYEILTKDTIDKVLFEDKLSQIEQIIDTATHNLKRYLIASDSLIEYHTMTQIQDVENRVDNAKNLTQLILLSMAIFSICFALIFASAMSRSLRRLKESASRIATGDFTFNPRGYPKDEIGDLASAFFDMAHDLKKTQDELIEKRRLAAIGEIVASINHEINNPLMIISGNAQYLEMTIDNGITEDSRDRIKAILEETERISKITRKLRDIKNPIVEDYTSSGEQMINLDKSSTDE